MLTAKTDLRKQFLFDVFVTALEGGIGYWAVAEEYHWKKDGEEDLDGFFAKVSDCEGDTFPDNSRIDQNVIVKGLNKIVNDKGLKISEKIRARIKAANRLSDAGMIDADNADCIVQVGLLGELVFG